MKCFLWIALAVTLIDQVSKSLIVWNFREYEVVTVWPVFDLTLVYNRGAAFSFLADAGGWQQYLFVGLALVISLLLLMWLWRLSPKLQLKAWGLSLVLGGALGNLVDRLVHGQVVDFLMWHWEEYYFPSFNLADSAITLGVALLLIEALRGKVDIS